MEENLERTKVAVMEDLDIRIEFTRGLLEDLSESSHKLFIERELSYLIAHKIMSDNNVRFEGVGVYNVYILSGENLGFGEFEGKHIHSVYTGIVGKEEFFLHEIAKVIMSCNFISEETLSVRVVKENDRTIREYDD